MIGEHLTKGGIPDAWTYQNLAWLAQAHRRLAADHKDSRIARTDWHKRWAACLEDIMETYCVHHH